MTVAMDAQGPEYPRRYAQAARTSFPVLIDRDGILSSIYGFQVVPNGWAIDPEGVIRFQQVGGFDIRKPGVESTLENILAGAAHASGGPAAGSASKAMPESFQKGVRLLKQGHKRAAVEQWLEAAEANPENLLIRKQIWYVLHPDRFTPEIDHDWQRAQIEREKQIGIRAANPLEETEQP